MKRSLLRGVALAVGFLSAIFAFGAWDQWHSDNKRKRALAMRQAQEAADRAWWSWQ